MRGIFEYESDMSDIGRKYRSEFKRKGYITPETIVKNITTEHISGDVYKITINFWDDFYLLKWTIDLDEAIFSSIGGTTHGVRLKFVDVDYRSTKIIKREIYWNVLLMIPENKLDEELLYRFNPIGLFKTAYGLEIIVLKHNTKNKEV